MMTAFGLTLALCLPVLAGFQDAPSLKDLAEVHKIEIGANFPGLVDGKAPNNWSASSIIEIEKSLAKKHFTMMSGGWESYPGSVWPAPNTVSLQGNKKLFQWMEEQSMRTHYHGLGYGVRTPWLKSLPVRTKEEKLSVKAVYESMLQSTVIALRGRVDLYDLCNEQLLPQYQSSGYSTAESYWRAYIPDGSKGSNWIDATFRLVRRLDPQPKLIYLDFNNEVICPKSDFLFSEMKKLKTGGTPIDGVGFQLHLDTELNRRKGHGIETDDAYLKSLRANLMRFSDAGFDVWVTEFDISVFPEKGLAIELKRQAELYQEVMAVLLEIPRLRGVKFWGLLDKNVWGETLPARSNLFDEKGKPKAAYWGIVKALRSAKVLQRL